jgi:flagellar protein FlaI
MSWIPGRRKSDKEEDERKKKEEDAKLKDLAEQEKRIAEEKARLAAERKAREEAERKRREEEARKRAEEEAKRLAERKAREEAERKRVEQAARIKAEQEAKAAAERKMREEAARRRLEDEAKKRIEEQAKMAAERKATEDAESKRIEDLAKAQAEEQNRLLAEKKAKDEALRVALEQEEKQRGEQAARLDANRKEREEAERRRRVEEAKKRQDELAKREEERKRSELEAQKRRAEETAKLEAQKVSKAEADKKRVEEELKRREEERLAKETIEKRRKEEEEKRKALERERKEAEKKAKEEMELKRREEAERRRVEAAAAKETKSLEAQPVARAEGMKPRAVPIPSGAQKEQKERETEVLAALRKVQIRYPPTGTPIPPTWKVIERYPVNGPYAYAAIAESPLGTRRYYLDEVPLSRIEAGIFSYLLDALEDELTVPRTEVNPKQYFSEQARRILLKYSVSVPPTSWSKIIYFAERDLVGFGVIDGLMRDPNIEDISLDAVGRPIFLYHKGYESLETNIVMADDDTLDNLVTRLSHMAGKHVSTAFPIVQGTLPGRHRLVATFRREVSPLGSSATIRKFREDPLTIIDMLNLNLMDEKLAAYTWLLMQNRSTAIVVGATGAGKTTLLNALLTLTRLNSKIVTIEEVQEVNIPHLNWTSLVSRESYAATEEKAGAVDLFELVKAAMRMRPDILVVGEVRGEEAYVLFQAISTGHGGICTIHADDSRSALQRLESEPMNVPESFIPFLDLSFVVRRLSVTTPTGGYRSIRRIISVDEIVDAHTTNQIFRYEPRSDSYYVTPFEKSLKVQKIAKDTGFSVDDLVTEIERRAIVLKWLQQKGIRNFKEVSPILDIYAMRPEETYERAMTDLQSAGVPLPSVRDEK